MRKACDKPNINLVQSMHARSPTYFPPHRNHGQRWILNDETGDKGNLENKLPMTAFKPLAAQCPGANPVNYASMLLL